MALVIEFLDAGRTAQNPTDPRWSAWDGRGYVPRGEVVHSDASLSGEAGRADDPRTVRVACKAKSG